MEGTRAFVFMAIVAAVLAVEIGPLLPTPIPSPSNLTTNAESVNKTLEETTSLAPTTLIPSVSQNDTSAKDSKKGRAMNDTALDKNSSINSIHSNSTQNGDDSNKMEGKKLTPDLSDVSMDDDDADTDFVSKNPKESPKKIEDDIKANLASVGETRVLNKPSIMADDRQFGPLLVPAMASAKDVIETTCFDAGKMYKVGEHIERGCDEMCICEAGGRLSCTPRCTGPFLKRGSYLRGRDPLCNEKGVDDPCCSILVCAADTDSGMCVSGNKTYTVGETFNEGCKRTCTCEEGGNVNCTRRCPLLEQRDDCVDVPNPKDPCCMLQLCDVSQDVDEEMAGRDPKAAVDKPHNMLANQTTIDKQNKTESSQMNSTDNNNSISKDEFPRITEISSVKPFIPVSESMLEKLEPILSINALPNGTVQVNLRNKNTSENMVHLELSKDSGLMWKEVQLNGGLILGLEDGRDYIIRSKETGMKFAVNVPKIKNDNDISKKETSSGCMDKGIHRAVDEEFYHGCDELCICLPDGNVECVPLVCPSNDGLDALHSTCVQWAPDPPDFVPHPPACCPPAMACVSNGSCTYKGHDIPNWSEVPLDLSGCEQRCFCESGSVECQAVCAPLTALPPPSLRCDPPTRPAPRHPDGDKCCKEWACVLNDDRMTYSFNKTDTNKMTTMKDKQNNTEQNDLLPPPVFVTLPPDLHKVIEETFGDTITNENKKNSKPKYENPDSNKDTQSAGPYFTPNSPQYHNVALKTDKGDGKRYEYPGPFADPNHKAQPPGNGLGSFPFIKKHKDKPTYPYETEDPRDFMHYNSGPAAKDVEKKPPQSNNIPNHQKPLNPNEYHVNDPYLSGSPSHIPFGQNQNAAGPGFFNPAATKNQQDLLHLLQQANAGNGNPNIINGGYLNQPAPGIYQNNGLLVGGNRGETIHVYTDGSPSQIEHILQHIQQTDGNPPAFVPYGSQPQRPRPPNNNDGNSSANPVPPGVGGLPSGPGPLGAVSASGEGALQMVVLEASSPTSLRLVFSLPSVMVGLQGRVQLRYTDSSNPDPSSWRLQEFAPPEDLLATPQLEFQLGSLQPDTQYKIQAAVVLRQLPYVPKSHIYSVKTLPLQEETTLPPVIPIEPNLAIGQVNPTTAQINWRSFTQDELLYIDGIQLRYREIDGKVFSGTPLIHRAVTTFQLEGLKPNTSYEVGIYFIPFLGQHTELQSANMARLITPPISDMYDWNVLLDVSDVTAWGLALQWSGVPRPAERYVHVCRAVWRAEAARADMSSFSLPTRDAPPMANITGLTPGTRYRIWLELYLTNGKIKTSNVKDVMTKPGKPAPQEASTQEGKQLEGSPVHKGDYYSSLVAVGVLAALGAMTSLVLLLVLVRRHRTASAPICASATAPHNNAGHRNNGATLPPYDSPSYKIDLQQETMDL